MSGHVLPILIVAVWSPYINICVGNIEFRVYIAEDRLIGLDDSLEVDINEEIVRIDVLFDETFHL